MQYESEAKMKKIKRLRLNNYCNLKTLINIHFEHYKVVEIYYIYLQATTVNKISRADKSTHI